MRWSKNETVGFLHRFWWTVMKYAPNGCISSLPLEVVSGTLDMKLEDLRAALDVMRSDEVRLIDNRGGNLFVHDWLDYAGLYLQGSLYKRKPEKWQEVKRIWAAPQDSPKTGPELSQVPTNQPTNQPRMSGDGALKGDGAPHARDLDGVPFIPKELGSPAFLAKWQQWRAYQLERYHGFHVLTEEAQLEQCRQWGEAKSIEVIDYSIGRGAKGFCEQNGVRGQSKANAPITRGNRTVRT